MGVVIGSTNTRPNPAALQLLDIRAMIWHQAH
jgi:hypothetical protein